MKLKCEELTKTIMECFDNSMDDRFSSKERKNFLDQGKKLRALLTDLLGTKFTKDTAKVTETNKKIEELNRDLKEKDQVLKNIAVVAGNITELISALDDLLQIAAGVAKQMLDAGCSMLRASNVAFQAMMDRSEGRAPRQVGG